MAQETLGDFSIIKEIGEGALGKTFLAEHRFLKRSFALKKLSPELSDDPQFLSLFEKEISSLAALEHPHIVKVHNVTCAEGSYYLVADYIAGDDDQSIDLFHYLETREKPFDEEEVVKIAHQIASAIDYAHAKELQGNPLSHLGIKPSNILVKKTAEGLHLYLSDFGLTRAVPIGAFLKKLQNRFANASLTKDKAAFARDFAFLAPEQKKGDESLVDARADVYAFGVLIYYLLMKEFPEGVFDFPKHYYPEYTLNWDLLIWRCLQKDVEKRPLTIKKALEELLSGQELSALQPDIRAGDTSPKPVLKPPEIARPEFDADPGAIFHTELTIGRYQPKQEENIHVEPLLTQMKIIQGGDFIRGSDSGARDEMPKHMIHLDPFALDVHPVTNEQFIRFLEVMGGEKDANNNDIIRLRESRIKRISGKLSIESGYTKHPIVGVTWYGALAYAKWVGKRLPTEAEWEAAATSGVANCLYPTGNNIERSQANFFSSDTTAVMSYPPNEYGLYDMAGNVYEWCNDWYGYHYYDVSVQEPRNPKGPVQGVYRILRGGCWKSLKEDLRCAHRHRNNPGALNGTYGFRCAADVS